MVSRQGSSSVTALLPPALTDKEQKIRRESEALHLMETTAELRHTFRAEPSAPDTASGRAADRGDHTPIRNVLQVGGSQSHNTSGAPSVSVCLFKGRQAVTFKADSGR
ncbi:unnamed protein product [Pleuronectes platessa]|uniref:Uncharacterized protein n=1 Tax=Pleuronectes platessa TaxID=8262 RepID=A0A9N7TLL8_PLEPL|nr:unnamed protein product [Pleuronectes platessa]